MPGEEGPVLLVAVVPEVMMMAVVMMVAVVLAARMATMPAARGCIARIREQGSGERKRSSGGDEECARGSHGLSWCEASGDLTERSERKDPPGRIRPGGPLIAICLHVRDVADVDVASQHRAPHPARRIADVVVAVMTVVVVTVVVTVVVVVAVVAVTVVVVAVVVMAVVVMAVMAMTAAVPAAGRRIARGGEGRDGQRDGGDGGSEDRTLHGTTPGVDPGRLSPWGVSR